MVSQGTTMRDRKGGFVCQKSVGVGGGRLMSQIRKRIRKWNELGTQYFGCCCHKAANAVALKEMGLGETHIRWAPRLDGMK